MITSIDYAKAFNRLSFQHCLSAFARKGASSQILRIIATFLSNRTMAVRVGTSWSDKKPVTGGCPQGSILGFFLFNTTTDDLEDDFLESERHIPDDWSPLPETPGMARDEVRPPTSPPRDMGPVASSTPLRVRRRPTDSEEVEDSLGQPFVFVAGTVNAPPAPRPPLVEPPAEPNHWTRAAWKRRRVRAYKYVDDGITTEKVNFENATPGPDHGSKPTKRKQAIPSQNAFLATAHSAHAKGMKVNTLKTNLLCVSDAVTFAPVAFIEADGELLESSPGQRLKVLGFTLGDRPSVKPHVQTIIKKFRQRYWTLFNLKKHGFSKDELVTVYKTMILPLADYCDVCLLYTSPSPRD